MKKLMMAGALGALLLVSGCSSDKDKADETEKVDTVNQEKENETLTNKMKTEDGIKDGQVYEKDGTAFGKIELDQTVSDADAKKLADKYADEIKEEYKNLPVRVEVVRDGKEVVNVSRDPQGEKDTTGVVNSGKPISFESVKGLVVKDPILQKYIVRILEEEVPAAKPTNILLFTVNGVEYELVYDAERKLFTNGAIEANDEKEVRAGTFIIK